MIIEFSREFPLQIDIESGKKQRQKNDQGDPERPQNPFANILLIDGNYIGQYKLALGSIRINKGDASIKITWSS